MQTYWGIGSIAPLILNPGTRLTPLSFYPPGQGPGTNWLVYRMDRKRDYMAYLTLRFM